MFKGAIYGFIVGDALGVPYEFMDRGTFNCDRMTGFGTHDQPVGTWSDDTSMTLATIDSIRKMGTVNTRDMKKRFEDWLFSGRYTAHRSVFDVGGTTYQAIREERGLDDIWSNGNGSLMRVLPLAFTETTTERVRAVSAITHAHDISKTACVIYVKIAKELIAGRDLKYILTNLNFPDGFKRLNEIWKLDESEIRSSGFVIDTLESALWCLTTTDNFRDAVLKAVNLGSDTDTTGAVTGGLAGIIYGFEAIPKIWIEQIQNKEMIDKIIN